MRRGAFRSAIAAALLALSAGGTVVGQDNRPVGNPAAAERQYRVARRLAAEGSPEASQALQQVITLDPRGDLVDDALVDLALLSAVPRWPEDIGGYDVLAARSALERLDRVTESLPRSDRAPEARYLSAMIRLEPLPFHDSSRARVDLVAVTTEWDSSEWSLRARYSLAWLHEHDGHIERARSAYQRILVDHPDEDAGVRARVGLARLMLRDGEFGRAARRLQEAIDADVPPECAAEDLLELAVRSLVRASGGSDAGRRLRRTLIDVRSPAGFVPTPDGGLLVGDRRTGQVQQRDTRGVVVTNWSLPGLQALCVNERGQRFAAAGEFVYRLDRRAGPVRLAALGELGPVSSLAADDAGGLWLLDRKGATIARVDPGQAAIRIFWEDRDYRLDAMIWDGRRLVGLESRTNRVVSFSPQGRVRTVALLGETRPIALASDATGRLAVLDKSGAVRFLGSDGTAEGELALPPEDILKAAGLGLARDGALHLLDASDGSWVVRP